MGSQEAIDASLQHCLKSFDVAAPTPCKTHPGSWQGSERGKLHGTSSSDPAVAHLPLIVYAWDCCGNDDPDAEGLRQRHATGPSTTDSDAQRSPTKTPAAPAPAPAPADDGSDSDSSDGEIPLCDAPVVKKRKVETAATSRVTLTSPSGTNERTQAAPRDSKSKNPSCCRAATPTKGRTTEESGHRPRWRRHASDLWAARVS